MTLPVKTDICIVDVGENQIIVREIQKARAMLDESTILSESYKERLMEQFKKAMYEVAKAGDGQGFKNVK